jgi:hypothetical protein
MNFIKIFFVIRRFISLFIASGFLATFLIGNAASAEDADSSNAKKKQLTLSFEDELIEGASQKPELAYLLQKRNFNYNKLIKLRENFLPEMRRTADDVQRARGGN